MAFKEKVVAVKVHKETHERLKKYKEETGVSITFTIEKAVEEYFKQLGRKE